MQLWNFSFLYMNCTMYGCSMHIGHSDSKPLGFYPHVRHEGQLKELLYVCIQLVQHEIFWLIDTLKTL